MSVLFIKETTLKESTIINENVDNKKITPVIIECQDVYIQPIIGSGLYKQLKDQITANNVTDLNKTLLNSYIIPCLKAYILSELTIVLNHNFTNKNVGTKSSDDSQPLTMKDINALSDRYKFKAEWYAERATDYLLQNQALYPLYLTPGTGIDTIYPNRSNYSTGMVLDDYYLCPRCHYYKCECTIPLN
jgi:hypothetical protein